MLPTDQILVELVGFLDDTLGQFPVLRLAVKPKFVGRLPIWHFVVPEANLAI